MEIIENILNIAGIKNFTEISDDEISKIDSSYGIDMCLYSCDNYIISLFKFTNDDRVFISLNKRNTTISLINILVKDSMKNISIKLKKKFKQIA